MFGTNDSSGYLPGVTCDVKNCAYHGQNDCCHAESINVGGESARSKQETLCSTYDKRAS